MEQQCKILFHGEVLPGYNVEQVKQNIATLYKVPVNRVECWFTGKTITVKDCLNIPTAKKYVETLKRAGIVCVIESIPPTTKEEPSTLTPPLLQNMVCPKCKFKQPSNDICIKCGIVIKKYTQQKQDNLRRENAKKHEQQHATTIQNVKQGQIPVGHVESFIDRCLEIVGKKGLKQKRKTKFILAGVICYLAIAVVFEFTKGIISESSTRQPVESLSEPSHLQAEVHEPVSTLQATTQTAKVKTLIPYTIINRTEKQPFKVSFDIRVDLVDGRLPTEEELGAISMYLFSNEKKHNKTFVAFFLPGMQPGMGAFATAHHDPDMQVRIYDYNTPIKYRGGNRSAVPTFASISEMIEEDGEYSASIGTFKVIQESPVTHIQVSPTVFPGEIPDVIDEEIQRVMLSTIYKTFIHTALNAIKVTVVPVELLDIKTQKKQYLPAYSTTMQIDRAEANGVAKTLLGVNSLNEFVEVEESYYHWSQKFEKSLYNDQGDPTLDQFFNAVRRAAQK